MNFQSPDSELMRQHVAHVERQRRWESHGLHEHGGRVDRTVRAPKNVAMGKKFDIHRSPYGAVKNVVRHICRH